MINSKPCRSNMLLLAGFKALRQFVACYDNYCSRLKFIFKAMYFTTRNSLFSRNKNYNSKTHLFKQRKNYNLALLQDNVKLLFNCFCKTKHDCNIDVFFSPIHCVKQRATKYFVILVRRVTILTKITVFPTLPLLPLLLHLIKLYHFLKLEIK